MVHLHIEIPKKNSLKQVIRFGINLLQNNIDISKIVRTKLHDLNKRFYTNNIRFKSWIFRIFRKQN